MKPFRGARGRLIMLQYWRVARMIGRGGEIGTLETLLDHAVDGRGAALVLRGEAGIGKSALLEHAVDAGHERGMRVLSVTGVQAEVQFPYAGLDHLLRPLRRALESTGSPYRMAVEVLELLGDADLPVLLAIEDAHWLDSASWETLTFLCRRVESDRIAVVMAVREGEDIDRRLAAAGIPELRLEPLLPADAGTLLDRTAPGLTPALRSRVLAEAAGNPLGLVELGGAVARSGSSALLPSSLPLSTRVEQTFGGLVAELPPLTRELLLIAALDDGGNLDEILAAAAILTGGEVPTDAIQPAVAARLVSVDEQYELRFRHPLLRSALRQQAAPGNRRRVHAALVEVLADSPARLLWHRASAVPGPDEALARELTEAAVGGGERQAVAFALAAINRAVQLSQDPAARARRQGVAAQLAYDQGDSHTVRRLMNEIDLNALRPADQARLTWLREAVFQSAWSGDDRLLTYANAVDTMRRDGEVGDAVAALTELGLRIFYSSASGPVRERFTEVTLACGLAADDPRLTSLLLLFDPVEHGATGLRRLSEFVHRVDLPATQRFDLAVATFAVGAFGIGRSLALSAAADLRAQGRIGTLASTLNTAASASLELGDVRAALPLAAEGVALAEETAQPTWVLGGRLILARAEALRGDVAAARHRADAAEQVLLAAHRLPMLALVQRARGLAALAEGHADDAFRQLFRIFDPADSAYFPNYHLHALSDLTEAAVLGGFQEELRPVVSDLEAVVERSHSPALRVALGYARAALSGDYAGALAVDLTGWPFERARLQLTYGAALRRSYRVTESRPLLRAAAGTFDALGTTPWADRARAELRATGETRRKPMDALAALTPQEQQIARLAAEGLSNREIGERLFLSPRTVSTHLYRIYPKIYVSSRAELARRITSSDVV
ncbi:AAA ATPase-like protein [Asanoa ferruginea]|uniref:AAA ATPase-like protein n=1 Tax=Asanoa ferruginea TaxID=53367 RepID=A0A3D9ZP34_9ACTN|nr:AAA family ATPase [Asanoa ferruginea]REF99021.1 AAA ATPase-like protein [Asanoa ferruginea]GIF46295.1 LuxR family transcriptional regulator [Asanoa ferruginea]